MPASKFLMCIRDTYVYCECSRCSQRDVVYLGWPIALSYMSPNAGRGGSCSASEHSCILEPKYVNFRDLSSKYIFNLWYGVIFIRNITLQLFTHRNCTQLHRSGNASSLKSIAGMFKANRKSLFIYYYYKISQFYKPKNKTFQKYMNAAKSNTSTVLVVCQWFRIINLCFERIRAGTLCSTKIHPAICSKQYIRVSFRAIRALNCKRKAARYRFLGTLPLLLKRLQIRIRAQYFTNGWVGGGGCNV